MRILHTEWSTGWGGQEIRILREAQGMRDRGHEVVFACNVGSTLARRTHEAGFSTHEFAIDYKHAVSAIAKLVRLARTEKIDIINTHSSIDAWLGGIAARLSGTPVLRTRHLSTKIKKGLNSYLLYRGLADGVVTTCESIAEVIRRQASLPSSRCLSVPTGIDPQAIKINPEEVQAFREHHRLFPSDLIVGTVCILRSWKGITDLLHAAKILHAHPHLKWLVVGSGPGEAHFKEEWKRLGLERQVIFTGHLDNPFPAIACMDIFALLSSANEGVSQASLQAAYLEKPLITTFVGGLGEVCIEGETGYRVSVNSPQQVATCVERLLDNHLQRTQMGQRAKTLVEEKFTWDATLDHMERMYEAICSKRKKP